MSDYWKDNNIEKPKQIVVCAACKLGEVVICSARHWDTRMRKQVQAMGGRKQLLKGTREVQGFIDQFGDFLTREEALAIVKTNGQQLRNPDLEGDTILFSEDIY